MITLSSTTATPDGAFTILMAGGSVIASGWTDEVATLVALIHPDLRPPLGGVVAAGPADINMRAALAAVAGHYAGDVDAPAAVPVRQQSGAFRMRAWEVLREVSGGESITYTEFAALAGVPTAVRAAASACARNAAALFVPCHRVLRSDGTPGGFRYGPELKQRLLAREADAVKFPGRSR
ncbi:methylated-DNA--[protein]-cysteine S-methyltransferase [Tessaracoccus sp.]